MSLNETSAAVSNPSVMEALPFKQSGSFDTEPFLWAISILFLFALIAFFMTRKSGANVVKKYFSGTGSRWQLVEKKKLTHDTSLLILLDGEREIVIVESKVNVQVIKDSKQQLSEDKNENKV